MTEPAAEIAQATELAPGMGITLKPAFCTSSTKRAPGSETPGVPASEI